MMSSRKLVTYSLEFKASILKEIEEGVSISDVSKKHSLPQSTVSTWLRAKQSILSSVQQCKFAPSRKRMRTSDHPELESALFKWFLQVREDHVPISGAIILTKANHFAEQLGSPNFHCSNGWLERFKARFDICSYKLSGVGASVTPEMTNSWMNTGLKNLLSKYKPQDIFNADETGLFFKMLPDTTLAIKCTTCHGGEKSKERLTVLVCCNMDGSEKRKLLVIGKAANPRCFKNVKSFPVEYRHNKKSWITGDLFTAWLRQFDKQLKSAKRKVAMVMDNYAAQPHVQGLECIELVFLPPRTTSSTQPLDMGIIKCLKFLYRKKLLSKLISSIDGKTEFRTSILDAMHLLHASWLQISSTTIVNCFAHAGFKLNLPEPATSDNVDVNIHDTTIDFGNIFERLSASGFVCNTTNMTDYVSLDSNLDICTVDTDDDIILSAKSTKPGDDDLDDNNNDDDGMDVDNASVPTYLAVQNAVHTLRCYVQSVENAEDMLLNIANLERFITTSHDAMKVQSKITDFFKK